jgi:hypothetical protein
VRVACSLLSRKRRLKSIQDPGRALIDKVAMARKMGKRAARDYGKLCS